MKTKIVHVTITKMHNRRIGLAQLSDGSWYIKCKSLCVNLGTGHKFRDENVMKLTSEAMNALMTMYTEIIMTNVLHYNKEK
jgi:hypothetical protein